LNNNSIEGDVIQDIEDDNLMISQAHSVIGITSTLCFKPIQMGIPTAILNGGNFIGAFETYDGICELEQVPNQIENQLKRGRDLEYISNNIEGGVDYNSTDVYVDELIRIVG
jgi:hypothetical protein